MKKLKQIILLLICNLVVRQLSGQPSQDGAVKFIFLDSQAKAIVLDKYTVKYNKLKITLRPSADNFEDRVIKTHPGFYTFHIQTEKFKDVIITNVEIPEDKTNYVRIQLIPKQMASDKSVINLKYQQPEGEKNCEIKR